MKRQSYLVLLFAFLSVIFFLLLIFLRIPFPLYPLMSWQDVLDILTPLVLLPVYRVLFKRTSNEPTSSPSRKPGSSFCSPVGVRAGHAPGGKFGDQPRRAPGQNRRSEHS